MRSWSASGWSGSLRRAARLLGFVGIGLSAPKVAAADEPIHYELRFSAGNGGLACAREDLFVDMVNHRLSAPLLDPPAARAVSVRVSLKSRGYAVDIVITEPGGETVDERHLAYPRIECTEVLYHAAFETAALIEPNPTPPPCPACEACAVCETCPPRPATPRPSSKPRLAPKPAKSDERPRLRFLAGLLYGVNVGPEPAPGAQLGVQYRGLPWSIELDGRYTLHTESSPRISTLTSYTVGGVLAPCRWFDTFAVCGVVAGGVLGWRTHRAQEIDDRGPYVGLGARVTAEKSIPVRFALPLAVRIEIDGTATVIGPQIRDQWRDALVSRGRAYTVHAGMSLLATF